MTGLSLAMAIQARCNQLVSELPSGTVSLVFSDIEGSTRLLSRLGSAYADALDGQRQVLRKAWMDHGGTELGTEGDSFMVVFPTAEQAVAAARQGQQELAAFEWPAGEQVRVRMGIHTGTPQVHDGGYVGMDVHRAARIAAAAHGGQVLMSSATAELATGCLPNGVTVKDLGTHQLKDIARSERLVQLVIEGLPADFPPVKTLGASSSLPRPASPLVGRDGELDELTTLLGSPEVRLVTLTGPGGSGKTRLALGVAERLKSQFPDGVYFVPLASVTTSDAMWTSIAETLDVPPEGRIPPGFFDHVVHRTALLVLDNLEQIDGADGVVAELLAHAPQVACIATSRRALALEAEHVYPVPPLELPITGSLEAAQASGAVQLFAQQARKVRPAFQVAAGNVTDVAAICRRLDGLPLAIELAAARTRLLSPAAILARLDDALDIAAAGKQGPSRQKTLRDTIAWSYDLLTPELQSFFRRLGVFASGAGLDAIIAVSASASSFETVDPLGPIADLLDASLVTVGEDAQGEPRVGMLATIRAYAIDRMAATGELENVRRAHARYFLKFAELWGVELSSGRDLQQHLEVAARIELDLDNIREALRWALSPEGEIPSDQAQLGLRLCAAMGEFWVDRGYYGEGRRWIERALSVAGDEESVEFGRCLHMLSHLVKVQGDTESARTLMLRTVELWRRVDDKNRLAHALSLLAWLDRSTGDFVAARRAAEEVVSLSRHTGDRKRLAVGLWHLAIAETDGGNFARAVELLSSAADIHRQDGDDLSLWDTEYEMACILRQMSRPQDALAGMREVIPHLLQLPNPESLVTAAEDYGAILADLDDFPLAVRLLGSAEAMRERIGAPREPVQQAEIGAPYDKARAAMDAHDWEREYHRGRHMAVEDALAEALGAP